MFEIVDVDGGPQDVDGRWIGKGHLEQLAFELRLERPRLATGFASRVSCCRNPTRPAIRADRRRCRIGFFCPPGRRLQCPLALSEHLADSRFREADSKRESV